MSDYEVVKHDPASCVICLHNKDKGQIDQGIVLVDLDNVRGLIDSMIDQWMIAREMPANDDPHHDVIGEGLAAPLYIEAAQRLREALIGKRYDAGRDLRARQDDRNVVTWQPVQGDETAVIDIEQHYNDDHPHFEFVPNALRALGLLPFPVAVWLVNCPDVEEMRSAMLDAQRYELQNSGAADWRTAASYSGADIYVFDQRSMLVEHWMPAFLQRDPIVPGVYVMYSNNTTRFGAAWGVNAAQKELPKPPPNATRHDQSGQGG